MKTAPIFTNKAVRQSIAAAFGLSVAGVFSSCATKKVLVDPTLDAARVQLLEGSITRDQSVIQPLLAPDFAWREDIAPLSEEPYDYWSRHKLWANLQETLQQKPAQRDGVWVAPTGALRESYKGPRLAWRKVGAEWRLAYFYPGTALAQ